jgi:asparagine synthetase B (glutamine-hydrolysing)
MTLLAGIFNRNKEQAIPPSLCDDLRRALSRNPADDVITFKDQHSYFLKIDIGAFGEPAFHVDSSGSFSMLAGEPLLSPDDDDNWRSRTRDLELLHASWDKEDWNLLARARGAFCAVHYQPQTGTLRLIADKLCIRPLYYWVGEKYVVFATALRVLENLAEIRREMDVRAVTEMIGLGVPLGTRTPYANIFLLRAAEVLEVTEKNIKGSQYWRWDDIPPAQSSEPELLSEIYRRFTKAIALRIRDDSTAVAFLSGGLDSRCIVAALRDRDVRVHTFTFGVRDTQDQAFAARFAERAGTLHEEVIIKQAKDNPNLLQMLADAWNVSPRRVNQDAERPMLVWSGDGGSVGLGHVYVSRKVVDLLRDGKADAAIEEYLLEQHASIPRKLLTPEVAESLSQILHEGVRDELNDIHHEDAGRSFHIFLMLNDQRRHLSNHFENIDLHRLELQVPFLDSDFLASIIAAPLDLCLAHKLYTKWLALFPPAVTSVPWQAYDGHEPCPLPIPPELARQWEIPHLDDQRGLRRKTSLEQAADVLNATDFPHQLLKRRQLYLATWIHRMGLRDYDYVIQAARTYHRYWALSGGYVLPSIPASSSDS